ncbi:ABC transporter ATP-binding protein [Xylophilus sp.]|uniref:ABC transporter ATP-binding protein n=1 Tax=Xylophilus sp. TaxID=2653893 RepID=UPI0013B97309|nr:ATP-binding cassette domain-containing protein [Xylophilus sp.]KAF1047977.1 MAG: Sulfate/thiosulfate import ATP-binding protein CysA [Xylophilus sp.]
MSRIDIDIDLSVAEGRRRFDLSARIATDAPFAALYGPSGAGKSLTLQAVAGLLAPRRGHIRIGGRTLFDAARGIDLPAAERRVGYLFQHYALLPHLSVRDNVAFGLTTWWRRRPAAAQRERVRGLLDAFGLAALAEARPRTLSGGQQQRVALARALACEPRVLLLDEPFAALNPLLRAGLRDELARVRAQWDIPALMVTHDVDDVLALADAAFLYADGRVHREIDLHTLGTRDHALEALGAAAHSDSPLQARLRDLLTAGGERPV